MLLKSVLLYHVVKGKVPASTVVTLNGKSAKTVNGAPVKISIKGGKVYLNGSTQVTKTDIMASNGIDPRDQQGAAAAGQLGCHGADSNGERAAGDRGPFCSGAAQAARKPRVAQRAEAALAQLARERDDVGVDRPVRRRLEPDGAVVDLAHEDARALAVRARELRDRREERRARLVDRRLDRDGEARRDERGADP